MHTYIIDMKDANARHTQLSGFFLALFSIFLFATAVQATDNANFSWLPNQETNLDGYEIHYGTASGNYTIIVDVGNPAPVDGRIHGQVAGADLNDGTTYYFAVIAKDTSSLQSDYSTEVVWTATSVTANEPPIAENTAITVSENSSASGQLQAQDPDNDSLNYSVVTNPGKGTLTLNSTGTFAYTLNTGATGTDSFTFQVSDGQATSNTATVSITISATNDTPTAENATISVNEDSAANGQLQAQDPDGDSLTYTVVTNPARGTLSSFNTTTGVFTYTPNANATGTDSFTFQVSDGQATSNTATVSITISPNNDAPVAQDGTLNAVIGQTTSGTLQASDTDNDPLTFSLVSDPQQAVTITNSSTGAYTFNPAEGMNSPYTFTFTVNDGTVDSNTSTVTVTLMEAGAVTEIFGDTPDSTQPGTLTDTYTNLNENLYSSAEQLVTYSWSSLTPHKPANTIIIKTDLSALNESIQIIEAKLYLYQTNFHGDVTYENSIHKITGKNPILDQVNGYNAYNGEPWTPVETETTHTDIPLGLADIDQAEDSSILGTLPGYQTWLITNMVQDWISDPAGNFGLLISGVPTNSGTGRYFAASENQNGSLRPKLVIRYIIKPPKPNVFSARQIQ